MKEFEERISKYLKIEFEKQLCEAAFTNLIDKSNKLRFNNFAYSIRELTRHILKRLAPDKEVLHSSWYKSLILDRKNGITRSQRIQYAIQGGISDSYVEEVLEIDKTDLQKSWKEGINRLSKFTHVNPNTFDIEDDEVNGYVSEVVDVFEALFGLIEQARKKLESALLDKLTARREEDGSLVHASNVTKKDGPFYCPETYESVCVRRCKDKRNHFAYTAAKSPTGGAKESELHENCKQEICSLMQKRFPNGKWELERKTFSADPGKGYARVQPDISGRIENGRGVVIEVQGSTLSIDTIRHRTVEYTKRGAYILWIVPLKKDLGTKLFRPRLFEKFLHSMYYGRIYYWVEGDGTIIRPVHLKVAGRDIPVSTWMEGGGERTEGGYYKEYKKIKAPDYGEEVDIRDFFTTSRPFFVPENEKLAVPECNIFMDGLEIWW